MCLLRSRYCLHFTTTLVNHRIFGGVYVAHLISFFCCPIMSLYVQNSECCDVRYDFNIKSMFGSSLPPVACRRNHVLFTLFVFAYWCPTPIVFCFCFVLLRLVNPVLPFFQDCLFSIAPLALSNSLKWTSP